MATDVERLMIRLEASASKFERDMDRARGVAARRTKEIEDSFAGLKNGVVKIGASLGAAVVAALSLDQIRKAADTYTNAINQIKVAGASAAEVPKIFDQLFASAQANAVPVEALAQLYGRVSQAQATLKVSSADVLQMTDIVAQSLRVSGASAESASGALLQLAQALSGGTVQAEEWNSLLDGMYPLLQAAASGIKEAGGDVATLTRLVKDGEVSSKALFEGIRAGSGTLKDKLGDSALTVGQSMTKLNNEFVRAVGEFDRIVGVSPALANAMDKVAGSLTGVAQEAGNATNAVLGLMKAIVNLPGATASVTQAAGTAIAGKNYTPQSREVILALREDLAALEKQRDDIIAKSRNADARDMLLAPIDSRIADMRNRLASAPALTNQMLQQEDEAQAAREAARGAAFKNIAAPSSTAISLKDYPANAAKGGGGGGSSAEKVSDYERQMEALRKKTELLRVEAGVIEQGNLAVERARIVRELELAAKKSGVAESAAVQAAIQKEADAHMAVKKVIEDKTQAMEAMKELQQFIGSSMASFFSDVVSGGKNASEALMNLTKRLADAALQAALLGEGPLGKAFGTAGKDGAVGGLIGALFKGFGGLSFGGARAGGGPVAPGSAYLVGERGPEIFAPRVPGVIVPNGASAGGRSQPVINISLAANGDASIVNLVRGAVARGVAESQRGEYGRQQLAGLRAG